MREELAEKNYSIFLGEFLGMSISDDSGKLSNYFIEVQSRKVVIADKPNHTTNSNLKKFNNDVIGDVLCPARVLLTG